MKQDKNLAIITSLPPILGISNFSLPMIKSLSQYFDLQLFGYYYFYPPFLKIKKIRYGKSLKSSGNIEVNYTLNIFNPFSWINTYKLTTAPVILFEWWNIVQLPHYIFLSYLFKRKKKIIMAELHNPLSHETIFGERLLFNTWIKLVDKVIVHTRASAESINHKSINIIHYGTYPCNRISRKDAREKLSIPDNAKVLLFFGNMRPYKGLDILLESFKMLANENKNVWLIVAGRPWRDFNKYKQIIDSFDPNINSRILLKNEFIPDKEVPIYFSASDLLILPYKKFDSQSGVIMLSISCGLPYVVTNVKGLSEFALGKNAISKTDPLSVYSIIKKIIFSKEIMKNLKVKIESFDLRYNWNNYGKKIFQSLTNATIVKRRR